MLRGKKGEVRVTPSAEGGFTHLVATYVVLPELDDVKPDKVTDEVLHSTGYQGRKLAAPLHPGRGKGCGDVPTLNLLKNVDPFDVRQGNVGDW